ncbi:hypothetical protein WI81_16745 [Burkholderia ubonensis]|nr:hypothetical protein WI81_16745 [Burkholderia ubonensis]
MRRRSRTTLRASKIELVQFQSGYDPAVRASLLVSYVIGRWHRFAKSGFSKAPGEQADAQLRLILQ